MAGHACIKAALFFGVGIVLHRLRSVNETWLHGRGRRRYPASFLARAHR